MNKRTRKKLRLEEFTEWGFKVDLELDIPKGNNKENNNFLYEIIDFVEANDMYIGGSPKGFYVCRHKKSVTEEDRAAMLDFLSNHDKVKSVKVSPFTNSWFGGTEPATRYNYKQLRKKLWEDF